MPIDPYITLRDFNALCANGTYLSSQPSNLYLGVSSTTPQTNGTGVTEPTGAGYARIIINQFSMQQWTPSNSSNIWTANHVYALGFSFFQSNGFWHQVTTNGTSGATQPTWNETIGGTTSDNTIVWTNVGWQPNGVGYSGSNLTFAAASGSWLAGADLIYAVIYDALTAGNLIAYWPIVPSCTVSSGQSLTLTPSLLGNSFDSNYITANDV